MQLNTKLWEQNKLYHELCPRLISVDDNDNDDDDDLESLPPAVLNCDSLSILSNPDLKLICFLPLSANYSTYLFRQRLCSRLTALWRYINFVLLLLLLLLLELVDYVLVMLAVL